ncbi:hypothetical protein ACOCEA_04520 [Maribacter sp. CXY002]|uniref:hypothetical protein n=1 Tax=Maribacter luteocoastalis TaxID=3407671 RepID=UPI003B66E6D1
MADQQTTNSTSSDEIDLGQLFKLIKKGFDSVFRFILRVFLYLKKNIIILITLTAIGLALGYVLNKITSKKLKTEIIVKPQLESKNYLYEVINEIDANLKSNDTVFFKNMGVNISDTKGLEITISRVEGDVSSEGDIKYLELLQSFENTAAISDILRTELQNKSSYNHKITLFYKDPIKGQKVIDKLVNYLNTNKYFEELIEVSRSNAKNRISQNQKLLEQVDEIISNYAKKMVRDDNVSSNDRIVLDNQETVNITGLFSLKNNLIQDIESKKLELIRINEPIKVINLGKPQVVQKSFFGKNIVLIPLLFLTIFFLMSFIKFLNKKTKELY